MRRRRWLAALSAATALAAACTAPPRPAWGELSTPGGDARILAMERVGDRLLAVGSVAAPHGRAPAAWTTGDGQGWRAVPIRVTTGYGSQAELVRIAAAGDRISVLGQAFGGAHGNPRPTVFAGSAAELVEYRQPMETFGGPRAMGLAGAAGRPGVALLVGQWERENGRSGAATWTSGDGASWTRHTDDPVLSSTPGEQTGTSGVTAGLDGFLAVGTVITPAGVAAAGWTSPGGVRWRRLAFPAGPGTEAGAAHCDPLTCVVLGAATDRQRRAQCWPVTGGQVTTPTAGPGGEELQVSQALLIGDRAQVVLRIDGQARLATVNRDCTDWRGLDIPAAAEDATLGQLPDGGLVLATSTGTKSRLWLRTH